MRHLGLIISALLLAVVAADQVDRRLAARLFRRHGGREPLPDPILDSLYYESCLLRWHVSRMKSLTLKVRADMQAPSCR